LDVSNSNTPGHFDPSNPVPSSYRRAIGLVDGFGNVWSQPVNAYSGNNGRSALETAHDFPLSPKPDDGPVTVTVESIIRLEDREEFLASVEQLRLIFLRNGAFLFRVDEKLEHPGTFRMEMLVGSWAEHLRQHTRMTKAETELIQRVLAMHAGDEEPVVWHYLQEPAIDSAWLQSVPETT
jgi:Transmembrane secretion effector